jgi:hypothetical protein
VALLYRRILGRMVALLYHRILGNNAVVFARFDRPTERNRPGRG